MSSQAPDHSLRATHWSLVERSTAAGADPGALAALHQLAQSYWYPLYAFARCAGCSPDDAANAMHGFFARLLEPGFLAKAKPGKGLLRPFLLACLQRCLADGSARAHARACAANADCLPLDTAWAEARYAKEPPQFDIPEALYDRCWAMTLLDYAMGQLEKDWSAKESTETFLALRPFLGYQADDDERKARLAEQTGLSLEALKSKIFALRTDYRNALLAQIAFTSDDHHSEILKAELMELLTAV